MQIDDGPKTAALDLREEIEAWKKRRNAVVLAHNYQIPEVQDSADFVGDSLALARAARESDAERIVLCGVYFMAETAALLCPGQRVLSPDPAAGCSLADSITVEQLRRWKAEHPGAVVVAYVNTSAAVKAEADICCTSSNAVAVIRSIPAEREILFLPDMFLGSYLERVTGRRLHVWWGECHVHAGITPEMVAAQRARHPEAEFIVHPECSCTSSTLYMLGSGAIPAERAHVLSTGAMLEHARRSGSREFVVATETGILHRLRRENPDKTFLAVSEEAVCGYMKQITLEKVLASLRDDIYEVRVPPEVAEPARRSLERMLAVTG